jgi:hypothetical protein
VTPALVLIAMTFAAYRLTRFLVEDSLLDRPREAILTKYPPNTHKLGTLLSCVFCAGWWISGAMLGLAHLVCLANWSLKYDLVLWWAVAGGQALLSSLDGKLNQ